MKISFIVLASFFLSVGHTASSLKPAPRTFAPNDLKNLKEVKIIDMPSTTDGTSSPCLDKNTLYQIPSEFPQIMKVSSPVCVSSYDGKGNPSGTVITTGSGFGLYTGSPPLAPGAMIQIGEKIFKLGQNAFIHCR